MSNQASPLSKKKIHEIFPQISERYKLSGRKPIGARSGFGAVWQAHDQWLQRDVAIKISAENLSDELRLCRDVEGQTVRIFEYFRGKEGWNAYAMELLDTPWSSLGQFIAGHKYKKNDVQHYFDCFEIARSILNGLAQIHGRPYSRTGRFVHADIKPDNLFVLLKPKKLPYTVFRMPPQGEMVKIIDMGISTTTGDLLPGYTHAYGHPESFFARQGVDLYSLAIIFLELVTGVCPDHSTMEHKARIRSFLNDCSSGSAYLDTLAIEFASSCARSATVAGARSHRLLKQLDITIFAIEPTYWLSIRAVNKGLTTGCNRNELADFLFDIFAKHYGWSNKTEIRLDFLKDSVRAMYKQGVFIRDGHSYFIR
jgi:serine/threonine protein kinase